MQLPDLKRRAGTKLNATIIHRPCLRELIQINSLRQTIIEYGRTCAATAFVVVNANGAGLGASGQNMLSVQRNKQHNGQQHRFNLHSE
uniref:Conotoxin-like protein n=1 Tax=Spilarctia obliqua nucleopolyhedrovirus TaxID=1638618 RepID=A0A7G9U873_9ABAC|nr:conotoxin-like protein [Spilarctia obliqua nucleopolyhedrovirus]